MKSPPQNKDTKKSLIKNIKFVAYQRILHKSCLSCFQLNHKIYWADISNQQKKWRRIIDKNICPFAPFTVWLTTTLSLSKNKFSHLLCLCLNKVQTYLMSSIVKALHDFDLSHTSLWQSPCTHLLPHVTSRTSCSLSSLHPLPFSTKNASSRSEST